MSRSKLSTPASRPLHRCCLGKRSAVFVLLLLGTPLALANQSTDPASSQLSEIPWWPFISAAIFGLAFLGRSLYVYIQTRRVRTKVFPKLELRRRLYAPYSGGNCAEIAFDTDPDA